MKTFRQFAEGKIDLGKKLVFLRFGGLSSVRQKAYQSDDEKMSVHHPPARRGIYAFVLPFFEPFLLGKRSFDPRRMEWIRDKDGNIIDEDHPEYGHYVELEKYGSHMRSNGKHALYRNKKPIKFHYEGDIWHHLAHWVPRNEIIVEKGSWVKTSMQTYRNALNKESSNYDYHRRRTGYSYSMDYMEVFIEKV